MGTLATLCRPANGPGMTPSASVAPSQWSTAACPDLADHPRVSRPRRSDREQVCCTEAARCGGNGRPRTAVPAVDRVAAAVDSQRISRRDGGNAGELAMARSRRDHPMPGVSVPVFDQHASNRPHVGRRGGSHGEQSEVCRGDRRNQLPRRAVVVQRPRRLSSPVTPTAHTSFAEIAVRSVKKAWRAADGSRVRCQAEPSQCKTRAAGWAKPNVPTAHTSSGAIATTASNVSLRRPGSGEATRRQTEPSQCSTSVCCWPSRPTAHTSVVEIADTSASWPRVATPATFCHDPHAPRAGCAHANAHPTTAPTTATHPRQCCAIPSTALAVGAPGARPKPASA